MKKDNLRLLIHLYLLLANILGSFREISSPLDVYPYVSSHSYIWLEHFILNFQMPFCRFLQKISVIRYGPVTCIIKSMSVTSWLLMWPFATHIRSASAGGKATSVVSVFTETLPVKCLKTCVTKCTFLSLNFWPVVYLYAFMYTCFFFISQHSNVLLVRNINPAWIHARPEHVRTEITTRRAPVLLSERSVFVKAVPSCIGRTPPSVSPRTNAVRMPHCAFACKIKCACDNGLCYVHVISVYG